MSCGELVANTTDIQFACYEDSRDYGSVCWARCKYGNILRNDKQEEDEEEELSNLVDQAQERLDNAEVMIIRTLKYKRAMSVTIKITHSTENVHPLEETVGREIFRFAQHPPHTRFDTMGGFFDQYKELLGTLSPCDMVHLSSRSRYVCYPFKPEMCSKFVKYIMNL